MSQNEDRVEAGSATDGTEDPAIVAVMRPTDYRRLAVIAIGVGVLLTGLTVGLMISTEQASFPSLPLLCFGYGIYCARRAHSAVTYTMLRIDTEGVHTDGGVHDQRWGDVVMIWCGSTTGLRLPWATQSSISIFTRSGLDFARRAGTRVAPRAVVPVGNLGRTAELCARLRRLTPATVIDGARTSRARAALMLQTSTTVDGASR